MHTHCIREGQVEVGIVEHQGHEFAALGASVVSRHVNAYTKNNRGEISLKSWCGQTILGCRCEVVERFWSGSVALIFQLTRSRFIVGYTLGDHGMLFRGELLTDCDEGEARSVARQLSDQFAEIDAEDEMEFAESW